VTTNASADTVADTATRRSGEYGSRKRPATPAVNAKPMIIITHTVAAAAARRGASTRLASSVSSDVPAALTPRPTIENDSTAAAIAATGRSPIQATDAAAPTPPSASTAMPPTIQGVRRAETSAP
jgi:hypothetical protein